MTDLQINKALALAIGWKRSLLLVVNGVLYIRGTWGYMKFDFKNWNVIGPIAARYNMFPYCANDGLWFTQNPEYFELADTPQKAIALTVINAARSKT